MPVRVGYIGAGLFTTHFIHHQLARHDVDLVAICDLDEEKARQSQRRFGFREVYTDFRRMLETEKPDAVFCVGGPVVHHEVGLEVLERGFPLYVQKPPALTAAATRELAAAADQSGVACHVGFNLRFTPAVMQARRIIGDPEFGHPLLGIFRYGLASNESMTTNVIDQHCHIIDLALHLLGGVEEMHVVRSGLPGGRDYAVALRFRSGAVGTINCTSGQILEKEFLYFEVTGEASLLTSHGADTLTWRKAHPYPWWKDPAPDLVYGRGGGWGIDVMWEGYGYVGDVSNFIETVAGREQDLSPVQSTVETMELCEEILRQMKVSTPA